MWGNAKFDDILCQKGSSKSSHFHIRFGDIAMLAITAGHLITHLIEVVTQLISFGWDVAQTFLVKQSSCRPNKQVESFKSHNVMDNLFGYYDSYVLTFISQTIPNFRIIDSETCSHTFWKSISSISANLQIIKTRITLRTIQIQFTLKKRHTSTIINYISNRVWHI